MAISRSVQRHLAKGDFDALENEWIEHLAGDPEELDWFVGVARAVAGNGEEERAQLLLELLDEALSDRGADRARLGLLERAGALLLPPDTIHPAIVATLRRLHGGHSSFDGLAEKVGLFRAVTDLPKIWEKAARLEDLLRFDVGTVVRMEGRGAGRVTEINLALDSFRVDFERHPGLQVGFRAAPKLLEPLAPEHVLHRKIVAPEELRELAATDPPQLLHRVLTSFDRPLTGGQIREHLAGIVDDGGWTSWWSAARKDPHVVTDRSGRQSYRWADSHGDATEARWQAFRKARPRERIALLRRDGAQHPDLGRRMAAALAADAAAAAAGEPGLAYEIACALEGSGDDGGSPSPLRLVAESGRPAKLLAGIEDRAVRERAIREVRAERADWRQVLLERLAAEEDPRCLDLIAESLAEAEEEAEDRGFGRFVDGLLAQPHRAPAAFVWLAERAADDERLRARNPLRLLQQIFATAGRDEFAPHRIRIKRLHGSGGTAPRLLGHLEPDQGAIAREAIQRANGLESWEREGLLTALELRFPALRSRGEAEALYATRRSIAAKRAELEQLTGVELPANRKAIEEARALGDLRENFEYKSARQRHEYLSALATELDRDLGRVRPIDPAAVDSGEVRIGTRVVLRGSEGGERTLTVLGPWESDPERGVVSYQSELAAALLGKKPGDTVEAGGEEVTVVTVERAEL